MRYLRPAVPLSLILAAPAAASSTAAAGPSATPLILELLLVAIVIAGLTVRRRMARALASLRRVRPAPRRASVRARGV
jgi:hypothetical protein